VPIIRFCKGLAALVVLTACSGGFAPHSPAFAPAASGATVHAVAGARYVIRSFTYHVMPLRTGNRPHASSGLQYPDDLTNYGGPVMTAAAAHNIYVNCPAANQSCWGAPEQFQMKLAGSAFAALLRQYTKSTPSGYTFADGTAVTYTVHRGTALYENDLFQIIHQVAAAKKAVGYRNIYHVFLPKGTDTCFDFSTSCYSPDRPTDFAFCAYHGTVKYSDIGTVIYSIEPYQMINGCSTPKSAGASQLTNSTISTLAHETFEAITDPGPKLAWYNLQGGEIGDECEYFVAGVTLSGTAYNSQPMYSNRYHACATGP
jgi:hypothetical protein